MQFTKWKSKSLKEISEIPLVTEVDRESDPITQIEVIEHMGILEFRGKDAGKLLQGQLTCDVDALELGETTPGALCNNRGRILALFILRNCGNRFLMRLPIDLLSATTDYLQKYAQFYQTELRDLSQKTLLLLSDKKIQLDHSFANSISIQNTSQTLEHWLFEPEADSEPAQLSQKHIRRTFDELWPKFCVECGRPEIRSQYIENFLPHDLSLDVTGAVSFDKGCYTGQEIIARMEYRGTPKRRLYRVSVLSEAALNYGETLGIEGGKSKFEIVSTPYVSPGQTRFLAVSDTGIADSGYIDDKKRLQYAAAQISSNLEKG